MNFVLTDPERDPVNLTLEVDTGSGFQPVPARFVVSGGLTRLATSPTGTPGSFTLDSQGLFPDTNLASVRLRLTPTDLVSNKPDAGGLEHLLSITNNAPPNVNITDPGSDSGRIVLNYTVTDQDPDDFVQVTVLRWTDLGAGVSGDLTVAAGQKLGLVPFSATGVHVVTVWDSLADLGFGNDRLVTVTIAVSDGNAVSTETTPPFFVSNGPIANEVLNLAVQLDGFAVGDVTGDGVPDLGGLQRRHCHRGRDDRGPPQQGPELQRGCRHRAAALPGSFPDPNPDPATSSTLFLTRPRRRSST